MIAAGWPLFFIAVMVFSLVFVLARVCAHKTLLADLPNGRSAHKQPVSRAGGLAIMAGWGAGVLLAAGLVPDMPGDARLLVLTLLALALGLADDIFNLRPVVKFAGQLILAVAFVAGAGAIHMVPLPLIGEGSIGVLAFPLGVFWIVGMMNAYNFIDGANGLAASVGALILLVIAVLAAAAGFASITMMAFLLAVALAAFLPGNLVRGKIFMGDSGSQAISFAISGFAILLSRGEGPGISALVVPVLMLPIIADVAFTLLHRLRRRQNLLKAHREHIYQLLMRQGLSHGEVCGFYLGATAIAAAGALVMMRLPGAWQWIVPAILLGVMWGLGTLVFKRAREAGLLATDDLSAPATDKTATDNKTIDGGAA